MTPAQCVRDRVRSVLTLPGGNQREIEVPRRGPRGRPRAQLAQRRRRSGLHQQSPAQSKASFPAALTGKLVCHSYVKYGDGLVFYARRKDTGGADQRYAKTADPASTPNALPISDCMSNNSDPAPVSGTDYVFFSSTTAGGCQLDGLLDEQRRVVRSRHAAEPERAGPLRADVRHEAGDAVGLFARRNAGVGIVSPSKKAASRPPFLSRHARVTRESHAPETPVRQPPRPARAVRPACGARASARRRTHRDSSC